MSAPTAHEIAQLATVAGAKFPELVVAQFVLESDSGRSPSGTHNYFGLKGAGSFLLTHEYKNGKRVEVRDSFRNFKSAADCVEYLVSRWYKDWGPYRGINRAATASEAAKLLQSEGYATDPSYAKKLQKIMASSKPSATGAKYATLESAAKSYKGLEHQDIALTRLWEGLTEAQKASFTRDWRSAPAVAPRAATGKFPLPVPYFYQRDSKTGHGERMCFSSAMAMAMDYLDPEAIQGDDDWYLHQVLRYGDTVSSEAQVKAARSLGFDVDFRTNLCEADLAKQLDLGIPVPIGVLHKGPISSPSGGGHYLTAIGYDSTHFWVHDPFGEMDLVRGGYVKRGPRDGKCVRYTRKNLMKRWLINSKNDGWGMIFRK